MSYKNFEERQKEKIDRANEGGERLMKKCLITAGRYLKKLEDPSDNTLPFEWRKKMEELSSYIALIQEGSSVWNGKMGCEYQAVGSRLYCRLRERGIEIK
ncbi:MAG: hypothetical protein PVJ67_03340 [Candidatus Pacearchaeota archaeon]|jgi:hypothetical protein